MYSKGLLKTGIIILLYCLTNLAWCQNSVTNIRVWPSPGSIRIVFDLKHNVGYKVSTLKNPHRVVIDLDTIDISKKVISEAGISGTLIDEIRVGHRENNITRVVLEIKNELLPNVFLLSPNERYGARLVVDLESQEKQDILALFELDDDEIKARKGIITSEHILGQRDFVVAIDCGHGGEDPGAIGHYGTQEKDVVLAIGKKLKRMINQEPNMRAILTRGGDYYIGLRERFQRARIHKADLFISIHADAYKNKKANGASVFILSERGSSSEAAKWLAAKENRADLVGGVRLDNKGDVLASVLLDLSQAASKKASLDAAKSILAKLGDITRLHKKYVEQAGFLVLKAPDVPSLLVETGFISNPSTEKKLRTSSYQEKIARQILGGIKEYSVNYPVHTLDVKRERSTTLSLYIVKPGDSLSKIALNYKTSVSKLKEINQLRNSTIAIGQKLKVLRNE